MESPAHGLHAGGHGGYSGKAHDPEELGNPSPCCLFCARCGHPAPGVRRQSLRTGHPGSQGPHGVGHRGRPPARASPEERTTLCSRCSSLTQEGSGPQPCANQPPVLPVRWGRGRASVWVPACSEETRGLEGSLGGLRAWATGTGSQQEMGEALPPGCAPEFQPVSQQRQRPLFRKHDVFVLFGFSLSMFLLLL